MCGEVGIGGVEDFIGGVFLDVFFDGEVRAGEGFEDEGGFDFFVEFVVLEGSEFYDEFDVGPDFLVFFWIRLVEGGEAGGDFAGNVGGEFADGGIDLQGAAGDV